MDDDEDFEAEGMTVVVGEDIAGTLISNDDQWPTGVLAYHPLDLAVCLAGLAANVSASFSVFFADVRRDLCAARNRVSQEGMVGDFDEQLLALPQIPDQD